MPWPRISRIKRMVRLLSLWMVFVGSYFVLTRAFSSVWQSSVSNYDHPLPEKELFAPFLPNVAKSVVVIAYQRGGSTLFGNMFNTNPDVFYFFEPLDALYSDMYGTARGYNVPSEITNYWNGSERTLPLREITEVARFLRRIFQCETQKQSISHFVHPYYFLYHTEYLLLAQYAKCVDRIEYSLSMCDPVKKEIEEYCGVRFGEHSESRQHRCYAMLYPDTVDIKSLLGKFGQAVLRYRACNDRLRRKLDVTCVPMLRNLCSTRQVRAVKTVRATMDSMEPLLRDLPNFRVVHLMRDPRGVALSRMKFHDSARNRYSDGGNGNDSLVREAELYCRTVARDVRSRLELETRYPGKIFSLLYDRFVVDVEGYTERIYRFLDLDVTNSTLSWAAEAARGKDGRNATAIAGAWRDELTEEQSQSIVSRCQEFFEFSKLVTPL